MSLHYRHEGEEKVKTVTNAELDRYAQETEAAAPWRKRAYAFSHTARKYYLVYFSLWIVLFLQFTQSEAMSILLLMIIWCALMPSQRFWDATLSVKDIFLIARHEMKIDTAYPYLMVLGAAIYAGVSVSYSAGYLSQEIAKWLILALSIICCEMALCYGRKWLIARRDKESLLQWRWRGFDIAMSKSNRPAVLLIIPAYMITAIWALFYAAPDVDKEWFWAIMIFLVMFAIPTAVSGASSYIRLKSIFDYVGDLK